ncbi:MAG: hypothetical protein GX237_02830 [Clostridiales bacterium]|nr:hypothetical protein [Clostridiales bacterium]
MNIPKINHNNEAIINNTYNDRQKLGQIKEEVVQDDTAAVYEKKIYQKDQATIDRLIEETESSAQRLRDLVERMLLKQGQTINQATDIYGLLREGKLEVDEATRAQAQKDIAEDGYWGVEQTSERLFSFAKALTGGDPSKADEMIRAVKKGFKLAEKAWGGKLPKISKDTLDRTISKMEKWRDSVSE